MEGLAGSGDHLWGLEEGARSTQSAVETWWLTGWVGSRCGAGRGCRRGLDKLLVTPPAGRAQGFVFRQLVNGERAGIRLPPSGREGVLYVEYVEQWTSHPGCVAVDWFNDC